MRSHLVGLIACLVGVLATVVGAMVVVAPLHEQQQTLAQLVRLDGALVQLDAEHITPFHEAPAALADANVVAFQADMAALRAEHNVLLADTEGLLDALEYTVAAAATRSARSARRAMHADSAAATVQALRSYWGDALRYHVQTRVEHTPLFAWIAGVLVLCILAAFSLLLGYRFVHRHGHATQQLTHVADAHQWAFHHHPLPMLELAPTHAIAAVNEAFEAWTGHPANTLIGQPVEAIFPHLSLEVPERRRQVEHVYGAEALLEAANGEVLKADAYGMITPAPLRGHVRHAVVFIDRTAQRHAEVRTATQVAERESALQAIQSYAEERYVMLGRLLEHVDARVKEVKPMLFPGKEDALTPLSHTATRCSRVVGEAIAWLRLHRATINTEPVDMSAMAQAALHDCAQRYGHVSITWATDAPYPAFARAETSMVKHVLAWGLEHACRTAQGTPLSLAMWASDDEVGLALQVKGASRMRTDTDTEAAMGDGRSWAQLAVEKLDGHLIVHHGPQGEQGFSLRLPKAREQAVARRNAA
ncbi:MAG: PAS domain-containing protein [Bacteroidota bacterium]